MTETFSGTTITLNGLKENEWVLVNAIAERITKLPLRPVWQKIPKKCRNY